jgi:hypothetical protein
MKVYKEPLFVKLVYFKQSNPSLLQGVHQADDAATSMGQETVHEPKESTYADSQTNSSTARPTTGSIIAKKKITMDLLVAILIFNSAIASHCLLQVSMTTPDEERLQEESYDHECRDGDHEASMSTTETQRGLRRLTKEIF